jgi:hypothetical protein
LKSKKSLVEQVKKEQSGGHEKDKRYLNFYDLKDGEHMKVLLVPDVNGDLWVNFRKHGPNLTYKDATGKTQNVKGIGTIGAYPNNEDSPIMQKGYDLLSLNKETGDKFYLDEAKKWFPKEYTVMSCVVIESPMEINQSPDGNDVKLFNVPYKIKEYIMNQIAEEVIPEDEIFITPFVIKKSKNSGGWATYENSYFARNTLTDDELQTLEEDFQIDLFDYSNIDIVPKEPTIEELEEWLAKAEKAYAKVTGGATPSNDEPEEEEEEETPPRRTGTSLKDRIGKKKPAPQPEPEEEEDDIPFEQDDSEKVEAEPESSEPEEDEAPSKPSGLSDRLAKLRKK